MKKITIHEIEKYTNGKVITNGPLDESVYIDSVSSNSREIKENSLFVAIPGERVDGHSFLGSAFENGASVALISDESAANDIPDDKACVLVDDTIEALQKLATWYRRQFDIPVVAVTGSVGKTTTKEMISAALETGSRVLKTRGNMNSQLGVALMMFEIDDDIDMAVIEMGISEPNEMVNLTKIAAPETAVVTNIGVSHIGNMGSRENIRKEKLDVIKGFPDKNNLLLVPGNDDFLCSYDRLVNDGMDRVEKVIWYGENDNCTYRAKNIHNVGDHVVFDLYIAGEMITKVSLSVMGLHNVYNALAALAVADHYGLDIKNAAKGVGAYKPLAMRGQTFDNKGITIIDDTYNASPDSMKGGLNILWEKECTGRRIAALADVLELGDLSKELHEGVGRYIAEMAGKGCTTDLLITVGKEAAYIAETAGAGGIEIKSYATRDEAFDYLSSYLKSGDVILVKGSRGMQMDKLVEKLKEL